ncbi:MAG: hypothetical protein QF535_20425, partial [Anaerolineales bacterium]|nr:hypothetical protein [Anaerolineales bacterium]
FNDGSTQSAGSLEGTSIKSTSETGGTKFLREDGDNSCSWQTVSTGPGHAKNLIINGGMDIQQRIVSGTPFDSGTTPANNDDTYLVDRWLNLSNGNDIVDVSQQSSGGVNGTEKYIRLDVETASKKFGICQIIENKNLYQVIGGSDVVSLSFEAKVNDASAGRLDNIKAVVLAWDSTADSVTSDVVVGAWGAEDTTPTWATNWTAENTPANLSVTSSWARYTIENISIDTASTANIAVFIWADGLTATVTDTLEITNVQLEEGATANTFEYKSFRETYMDCLRYCWVPCSSAVGTQGASTMVAHGSAISTTKAVPTTELLVPMRAAPSLTVTAGDWRFSTGSTSVDCTAISLSTDGNAVAASGITRIGFDANTAGSLTQGDPAILVSDATTNRKMFLEAEL